MNRLMYDIKAAQDSTRISRGPMQYRMNTAASTHKNPRFFPQAGVLGYTGVSLDHSRPLVDVESDLHRLNVPATHDHTKLYTPNSACGTGPDAAKTCGKGQFNFKQCSFREDNTRLSNPIQCTGRELGINRFEPLCLNPQDEQRWLQQAEVGINYRMVVKDNHVPVIPTPLSPNALLPTGAKETRRASTTSRVCL